MEPINAPATSASISDLVRELASLYIGHPDDLQIRVQESEDGAAYFAMKGNPEDDSRLVGSRGCHVDALAFLVARIGDALGRKFTFRLITTPGSSAPWDSPKDALDYNPTHALNLLTRIIATLGVDDFKVEVTPGTGPRHSLFFNFVVAIKDREKAEALTKPIAERGLSTIGTLGTLFRAIAKQNGIRFQIVLANRD